MAVIFERKSTVAGAPDEVWRRVTSPAGINHELMPVMRMTVPRALEGKSIHEVPMGVKIGRSWFFLFGLFPIDFDDITIAEHDPNRRFLEDSKMLSMSTWRHERTLTGHDGTTDVHDRVTFQLRRPMAWIPGAHWLIGSFLRGLFDHRHRRLVRWFEDHPDRQGQGHANTQNADH
jgi:ligand-binding SRPBCC domain-containing protein